MVNPSTWLWLVSPGLPEDVKLSIEELPAIGAPVVSSYHFTKPMLKLFVALLS